MGRRQGQGVCRYANSGFYEGEWHGGLKHGRGKARFASGDEYEGEWREGQWHGEGEQWCSYQTFFAHLQSCRLPTSYFHFLFHFLFYFLILVLLSLPRSHHGSSFPSTSSSWFFFFFHLVILVLFPLLADEKLRMSVAVMRMYIIVSTVYCDLYMNVSSVHRDFSM